MIFGWYEFIGVFIKAVHTMCVIICVIVTLPSFTQKGESALMLAVKGDETGFYRFRMSKRDTTGVFSQLVEAGAALDLQDKVSYSNNTGK